MSYIQSILEPGEQVRYHTTISWTIYTPAILLAICALASAALAGSHAHMAGLGWLAAIAFAVAAVVAFVPAWFRRWTTEITVTDRRVILKRGLIRRHTVEMNMNKIESVDVDQSLLGRLFKRPRFGRWRRPISSRLLAAVTVRERSIVRLDL
jgi:uncharacterized membrane protein YdbT with pleckstrin-like domain